MLKELNLNKYAIGAAQPGLTVEKLNSINISLPPLLIQQKIADTLDRAAALIEKRKAQIAKLDLLVKSQFIQMFGDPATNPMGWKVERLGNIVKVRSSKRVYQREQTLDGVPYKRQYKYTKNRTKKSKSCTSKKRDTLFSAVHRYVPH